MFDWTTELIAQGGYWGILALCLLENLFPPIPSEVIMPLAGFNAARGEFELWAVIAAGSAGTLVGALPWYYLGYAVGSERLKRWCARYGRLFTLKPSEIDYAQAWFNRYGPVAVFFGRLAPAVRTLISVPAGVARMPLATFLFFSALGTVLWTSLLTLAGYFLESQYERVAEYVDPVSNVIIVLIVGYYLFRVVTFRPETDTTG